MVIYPLVLPVPPPLKGVGGTRALAHSINESKDFNLISKEKSQDDTVALGDLSC